MLFCSQLVGSFKLLTFFTPLFILWTGSYNYTQVHKYVHPIPPSPTKKARKKRILPLQNCFCAKYFMQSEKRVYEELKRWYIRKWKKLTMITRMPSKVWFTVNNSVVIRHSSRRFYDINDCIWKILHIRLFS
jgi:hypothetical protein